MFVCDSFFNFFEFLHENKSGKFQREQTVLISLSEREIKMSFAIQKVSYDCLKTQLGLSKIEFACQEMSYACQK